MNPPFTEAYDELSTFEVEVEPPQTVEPPPKPTGPDIADEVKVAFLAHLLTGAPFIQSYDIAGVGFVEFSTITPNELLAIRRLAQTESAAVPLADRPSKNSRIRALLTVACINRLEINDKSVMPVMDRKWKSSACYVEFVDRLPIGMFNILESLYASFSRIFDDLVERVSDRSFWPTL